MENKKELAPGIFLYSSIDLPISSEIMSSVHDWNFEQVMKDGIVSLDYNNRKTESIDVPYNDLENKYTNYFRKTFDPVEKDYMNYFQIFLKSHNPYKILKYEKGGKFENHMDDGGGNFRRVSTVYYLNEDYIGGEVCFPRFDIKIKPKSGDMLIFPSSFVYNHFVTEVEDGTRFSIASWLR